MKLTVVIVVFLGIVISNSHGNFLDGPPLDIFKNIRNINHLIETKDNEILKSAAKIPTVRPTNSDYLKKIENSIKDIIKNVEAVFNEYKKNVSFALTELDNLHTSVLLQDVKIHLQKMMQDEYKKMMDLLPKLINYLKQFADKVKDNFQKGIVKAEEMVNCANAEKVNGQLTQTPISDLALCPMGQITEMEKKLQSGLIALANEGLVCIALPIDAIQCMNDFNFINTMNCLATLGFNFAEVIAKNAAVKIVSFGSMPGIIMNVPGEIEKCMVKTIVDILLNDAEVGINTGRCMVNV